MTTTVTYATQARLSELNYGSPDTVTTLYANLSDIRTTRVTRVQTVSATGSTANPSATFTNTPAQNNVMLAFIFRLADNVASTATGWTSLGSAGAAGATRVEVLWKRAGASESKTVTLTNATAAAWEMTLIEAGGMAAVTAPWAMMPAASVATTAQTTSVSPNGMQRLFAGVICGNTVSSFGTSAVNHSSSAVINGTTRTCVAEFVPYFNNPNQTANVTWTTSRACRKIAIGFGPDGSAIPASIGNDANATVGGGSTQLGYDFDTSAVPTANTVTSATFTTSMAGASNTTAVELRANTASCVTSASDTNPVWKSNTELSSATLLATDAGGTSSTETFTSTGSFASAITKGGTTYATLVTEDQRTRAAGTLKRQDLASPYASNAYLTIVHNLQVTRTVAATTTVNPVVTRVVNAARSIITSVTASPTIGRIASYLRTVTSAITSSPIITRLAAYPRTIVTAVDATPGVAAAITLVRTLTTNLVVAPTITATKTIARTIVATINTSATIVATIVVIVVGIPHKLSLKVRSTVTLPGLERLRLTIRSRLRLPE